MKSNLMKFEINNVPNCYHWNMHHLYKSLAASPLASSGFAAIGCFRASPYGGIYIMKNYSKLTAKKSANFFFSKIQNFFCLKPSPDQDGTNKKRIFQIGLSVPEKIGFKQTNIDPSAIYKGIIYILNRETCCRSLKF